MTRSEIMESNSEDYLPFLDMSAWFSTSVGRLYKDIWLLHGGVLKSRERADYLFSMDSSCQDTKQVHSEMPTLVVFHPDWLVAVVTAHCLPEDHACGPYYLCPLELRDTPAATCAYNPNHPPTPPKSRVVASDSGLHSSVGVAPCAVGGRVGGAQVGPHMDALPFTMLEPLAVQDVVSLSECKPVLQPMFDFTPNENGCTVVRMKRGSKPRGKIYSTNKAAAAAAAAQAPSP